MSQRLAGAVGMVVFAACVVAGLMSGNDFATVLERALGALAFSVIVGLIIGAMAQKMLDEQAKSVVNEQKESMPTKPLGR